ncbi:HNH endonuclease [Nocardioides nanhaiensis]|uniref:HNH endonuclease signature motif containing protein n=1 Tax=Nocardioides nanhaiensis TaxID=1476871 RepID=A0ABP8WCT8_9ACTN
MESLLDDVRGLTATLVEAAAGAGWGRDERALVETLTAMEQLSCAIAGVQADCAVALDASVRAREAAQGVRAARQGRGVAAQVGLARQESPHRARALVGFAKDLATDLPRTREALLTGRLNEFRAMVIARESGCLDAEQRLALDEAICAPGVLDGLGTRQLAGELRKRVAEIDPAAVVRRHERAVRDRNVTVRPAPDGMAYLTGLLPLTQAVAAYAALRKEADRLIAAGDPRGRGQIMADLTVERLTGQKVAQDVPISVTLVMSDRSLLGAAHEPAVMPGHGSVPAQVAREAVARACTTTQAWIRRLYADPGGDLVALSTRQRLATDGLAAYLEARDQGICRTPWCDAPARHVDHVLPDADGGRTDDLNTQQLCVACNLSKQAPGWYQEPVPDDPLGRHTVQTTTPTGHRHRSRAPAPPAPAVAPRACGCRPLVVEIYRNLPRIEYELVT